MFRSASARLMVLYTAAFALAVVALGAIALLTTRSALLAQFDTRIAADSAAIVQAAGRGGLPSMARVIAARERLPGSLEYGLQGPGGQPLAGRLARVAASGGWSTTELPPAAGEEPERLRLNVRAVPGGGRLLVGDDLDALEDLDALVLQRFALALAAVVALGAAGGWLLNRDVRRRLNAISDTAVAIIDGDLSRRIPVNGGGDDLARLSTTLNRMLDRIATLMESLRQVSNDIAHDLRTPLTRLRQRLESIAADGQAEPLEAAIADLDAALETFAALLRIAQIEGGARRAGFRPVDLAEIAATVVEAFAPAAQDSGHELSLAAPAPAPGEGDRELLIQMLANLVENALRHTPPGTRIVVQAAGHRLIVRDDGPGVSEADRVRLFDRFYRPERSRSTAGAGLGLALAAAVARLHDAVIDLADARPGLEVRVAFPVAAV